MTKIERRSALHGTVLLAAALGSLLIALCVCGWLHSSAAGATAAAVAVLICAGGIVAGRLVGSLLGGKGMAPYQMLFGMLPRLGIPLGFCLVVYASGRGPLMDAGVIYYLLPTYLVTLGLETWLSLPDVETQPSAERQS